MIDATRKLDQSPPERLLGVVDWVTKKALLDQAGPRTSWSARKKIDIRYHELSADGYFELLRRHGGAPSLVSQEEIERAVRSAPSDSPATTRGHYIREFTRGSEPIAVNWKSVVIGRGWGAKVVRLANYGRRVPDAPMDMTDEES